MKAKKNENKIKEKKRNTLKTEDVTWENIMKKYGMCVRAYVPLLEILSL